MKTVPGAPRPLIVVGMGRSGTRMCANLLANSNDVELQGEVSDPAGAAMMAWLRAVREQQTPPDHDRIYRLARAAFRDSGNSRPQHREAALWFGHKTPRYERHFADYETIFDDPSRPAHYVYCLRNPFHVWRSYRVMPWNAFGDVRAFLKAWTRSVSTYEQMRAAAPGRVTLFNLDDMVRAPDRTKWIEAGLMTPLSLHADSLRRPLDQIGNSNSAANKLGVTPDEPPPSDMIEIALNRDAARMVQTYFPWMAEALAAHGARAPLYRRLLRS